MIYLGFLNLISFLHDSACTLGPAYTATNTMCVWEVCFVDHADEDDTVWYILM